MPVQTFYLRYGGPQKDGKETTCQPGRMTVNYVRCILPLCCRTIISVIRNRAFMVFHVMQFRTRNESAGDRAGRYGAGQQSGDSRYRRGCRDTGSIGGAGGRGVRLRAGILVQRAGAREPGGGIARHAGE